MVSKLVVWSVSIAHCRAREVLGRPASLGLPFVAESRFKAVGDVPSLKVMACSWPRNVLYLVLFVRRDQFLVFRKKNRFRVDLLLNVDAVGCDTQRKKSRKKSPIPCLRTL